MVQVSIADQSKAFQDVNLEWIRSTINKHRVMGIQNCVEIDIDSGNATLQLTAHCGEQVDAKPSNDIENRIAFLWDDLVLSNKDLEAQALYDFLERMDEWITFVPK